MQITDFFADERKDHWLRQIAKCDWRAGSYLHKLLTEDRFKSLHGESAKLLLLTEGDTLLAFCAYQEQDEIPAPSLTPWIGFVYTFPDYRGRRIMGKLLEYCYGLAKAEGHPQIYISTEEIGLYEKYGYSFYQMMKTGEGADTRVYRIDVTSMDYTGILGKEVKGIIDRPLGSRHPDYPDLVYPLNYGYIEEIPGGDGEGQDVCVLGSDEPLKAFTGKVIGVWHRLNDCEDKWIVSVNGKAPTREEILKAISFQEQYFCGELYT